MMLILPMKIKKVDHVPETHAVDQVAQRAADHRRKRRGKPDAPWRNLSEDIADRGKRHDRYDDEEWNPEHGRGLGQDSKGGSGIPDVSQVHKAAPDRHGLTERKAREHQL